MSKIVVCVPMRDEIQDSLVSKLSKSEVLKGHNVEFVHIFKEENYPYMIPPYVYPNEEQKEEISKVCHNLLDGLAKNINDKVQMSSSKSTCLFSNDPKAEMVDYLKEVNPDLTIMCTRQKHGFAEFFSSSFTEHLIKWCPTDMHVLRA